MGEFGLVTNGDRLVEDSVSIPMFQIGNVRLDLIAKDSSQSIGDILELMLNGHVIIGNQSAITNVWLMQVLIPVPILSEEVLV
jgi:predicted RNA-binding protein